MVLLRYDSFIQALSSFERSTTCQFHMSSDDRGEVTPVPMPNTEVKLSSADDSWGISPCESRTSLGNQKRYSHSRVSLFWC
jgi:hypothetical protein